MTTLLEHPATALAERHGTAAADVIASRTPARDVSPRTPEDAWNEYAGLILNDEQACIETHEHLDAWHREYAEINGRFRRNLITGEQYAEHLRDAGLRLLTATAERVAEVRTYRLLSGYEA